MYVYLLLRKLHVKCSLATDHLDCRISIKMASQPCGGTKANTVGVFTATTPPDIKLIDNSKVLSRRDPVDSTPVESTAKKLSRDQLNEGPPPPSENKIDSKRQRRMPDPYLFG